MKAIKTALVALVGFLFAAGSQAEAQVPVYRQQKRTVIIKKQPVAPGYNVMRNRNFGGYRHRYYDNRNHRYYWYNNGRRTYYRNVERSRW